MEKNLDKVKDRKFCALLYPDAENYDCQQVIEYLCKMYDTTYILHDKDRWTSEDEKENPEHKSGELKKPHYHLVFRWTGASPRYRTGIAKELSQKLDIDFPSSSLEPCKDLHGSLMYLLHYGQNEKVQYSIDELRGKGDLFGLAIRLVNESKEGLSEGEIMKDILDFIDSQEKYVTVHDIVLFCITNQYLNTYRRFSYSIHRLVDEHNDMIRSNVSRETS